MNVTIHPHPLARRHYAAPLQIPGPPLLIAAALGEGESVIRNVALSQDVRATGKLHGAAGRRVSAGGGRPAGARSGGQRKVRPAADGPCPGWTAENLAPPCVF